MNWLANLLVFLEALELALPPPDGHHSLTRGDQTEEGCLVLGVRHDRGVRQFVLWAPDFEKPQDQLIAEIVALVKEPAE